MNMKNWFREQLQDLLLFHTTVKEEEIDNLLDSINRLLLARRYAVVPLFLSDEMYAAQKENSPYLGYDQANKIYMAAIKGYLRNE